MWLGCAGTSIRASAAAAVVICSCVQGHGCVHRCTEVCGGLWRGDLAHLILVQSIATVKIVPSKQPATENKLYRPSSKD